MRGLKHFILLVSVAAFLLSSGPVSAFVNNGFETDEFLTPAGSNKNKIHDQTVRSGDPEVGDLGGGILYRSKSLTFAGTGDNDARLFTLQTNWSNIWITELNAAGTELGEANMATLAGETWGGLDLTEVRYNPLGDSGAGSLLIAIADETVTAPLKVYEINLDLDTLLNTYTGPNVGGVKCSLDVDWSTGMGYVEADSDILQFDTTIGSSAMSTLINNAAIGGTPASLIFREACAGNSNQDTLLVAHSAGPAKEYLLDGSYLASHAGIDGSDAAIRSGAQDKVTKDIIIGSAGDNHFFLNPDNSVDNWDYGWWGTYFDAGSPAPEPVTLVLFGIGLLGFRRRRRA